MRCVVEELGSLWLEIYQSHQIAAPELYEKVSSVLDLWSLKTNLGKGHPFRADQDIYKLTLDFTIAVLLDFPSHETMLVKQIAHLKSLKQTQNDEALELKADEPATFEDLPLEPELEACVYFSESIGLSFESAFPRLANWMYLRKKESRRRLALKNGLISRNINAARQRIESQDTSHPFEQKRRGVDQILLREKEAAVKEDRKPDFHKKVIYDEVCISTPNLVTFTKVCPDFCVSSWWSRHDLHRISVVRKVHRNLSACPDTPSRIFAIGPQTSA